MLGEISLLRILGKGKSGYAFLAELNGQSVVFKRMHNEPYPYYNTFFGNRVQLEVRAYQILQQLGIPIPELLGFDLEQQYLVKTYIDGPCGHEWLAQDGQDETIIEQLFSIASKLRAHDLNIDYFPANFVIVQGASTMWIMRSILTVMIGAWSNGEFTTGPIGPEWPSMPKARIGDVLTRVYTLRYP